MELSGSYYALVLIIEIVVFALLARKVHQSFYTLFYRLTSSEATSSRLFALLFLPGTFIHELSHFLMAKLLLVHATKFELMPVLQEEGLKLGSVSIEKTDPLRRLLIGAAPFIVGLSLILGSLFWMNDNLTITFSLSWWLKGLVIFGYFQIGNTMFSSRKDMEGAFLLLMVFVAILVGLYLLKWFQVFEWTSILLNQNSSIIMTASLLMIVPMAINFGLILVLKLFKNN